MLNVVRDTIANAKKKLFGCYSNTFITNNESKCKDKFNYTPYYNLIPHINYL